VTDHQEYGTAAAFRMALESRLKNLATEQSVDVQRLRRQVSFDRLLCRLFHESRVNWILKGGYAMELRMDVARTTRDIDLSLQDLPASDANDSSKEVVLDLLQEAVEKDLLDHFRFLVGESIVDLEGAPRGGSRFPVDARMDGRTFARFHIDVGIGDKTLEPLGRVLSKDWLAFAEIPPGNFRVISVEQQFAEKYHAYTRPWSDRPNSRVRDLVDMVLLIHSGDLDHRMMQKALAATFFNREAHPLPAQVPPAPDSWTVPFQVMAAECQIDADIKAAVGVLTAFMKNCLRSS
jgi:predicted nucleotidyltransferase component of viral defense system